MEIKINKPYGYSQLGQRESQQDALFPEEGNEQMAFGMVCDGVGGLDRGEVASGLACEAFSRMLTGTLRQGGDFGKNELEEVLRYAYRLLYENRCVSDSMATTLAFLAITNRGMLLAHIGDSRIYQLRPGDGIVFCTEDHSLVQEMVNEGKLTREEAVHHERRNVITRCLRVTPKAEEYDEATLDLIRDVRPHDLFLLCSDGVNDRVSDEELVEVLLQEESLEERGKLLKRLTHNSSDNNTALLIEVAEVTKSEEEEQQPGYVTMETQLYPLTDRKGWGEGLRGVGRMLKGLFGRK